MEKKQWKDYKYAVHPGEILQEYLNDLNMSQRELSKKTNLSKTVINEIIKGKRPITMRTGLLFENVFGIKATFWTNLQMLYDEVDARLKLEKGYKTFLKVLEPVSYNYSKNLTENKPVEYAFHNFNNLYYAR